MASIQIHDIRPAETPIEDLSYDVAGNITGGFSLNVFLEQVLSFVERITELALQFCEDNPDQCNGNV